MKVVLRELLEKDLQQTFLWHNDVNLSQQILSFPPPINWQNEIAWFQRCKTLEANRERFTKVICIFDSTAGGAPEMHPPQGLFVIENHFNDQSNSCEVGMFLYSDSLRGQGYGSKALHVGLQECQQIFPGRKIYLTVRKDNSAAIRFYERNGFIKFSEGFVQKHGSSFEVLYMVFSHLTL